MNKILKPIIDNLPGILVLVFVFSALFAFGLLLYQNNMRVRALNGSAINIHGVDYYIIGGDGYGSVRLFANGGKIIYIDISAAENLIKAK